MGSAGEITPEAFIEHWSKAEASERANAQAFLIGLAKLLGVPEPSNSHADGYSFEFPVKIPTGPGVFVDGRMDLYRRGCFVLEAKQFQESKPEPTQLELAAEEAGVIGKKKSSQPVRGTGAWDDAMTKARGQTERYVSALPGNEPTPTGNLLSASNARSSLNVVPLTVPMFFTRTAEFLFTNWSPIQVVRSHT